MSRLWRSMQRFWGIQERAGQKLNREIQTQRLNETGCKPRRLLTVRNERFQTKPAIAHCIIRFVFCCSGRVGILGGLDFQIWWIVPRYSSIRSFVFVRFHLSGVCCLSPPQKLAWVDIVWPLWHRCTLFHIGCGHHLWQASLILCGRFGLI